MKYEPLGEFLDAQAGPDVVLSFDQIARVVNGGLPKSAYVHDAWWSNSPVAGRHNEVWLGRGWATSDLNRKAGTVKFVRSSLPRQIVSRERGQRRRSKIIQSSAPLAPAPVAASNHVFLSFDWMTLGEVALDGNGGLQFPTATTDAGLYRIRINLAGRSRFYVGESQSLRGRFSNYRSGSKGQQTSRRIHLLLKDALAGGARVEVDIVTNDVAVQINGVPISTDLNDRATRRMIEHAAIVATGGIDVELANR
ncbi:MULTISPECIES: DUF7662 domain-containing protein [unclassified Sphingopyxis]|uniref:DUF7662 domain-containing protein n=1 Tax=unclassified Sphingopyxis TaxID=2614943 RepID=UPI000B0E6D68|nr:MULTISPECIES: hypothetical protein [unclassified Sphingopyxis]